MFLSHLHTCLVAPLAVPCGAANTTLLYDCTVNVGQLNIAPVTHWSTGGQLQERKVEDGGSLLFFFKSTDPNVERSFG